jgi:hypothetical protein
VLCEGHVVISMCRFRIYYAVISDIWYWSFHAKYCLANLILVSRPNRSAIAPSSHEVQIIIFLKNGLLYGRSDT